ncbi:protein jag [Patescibacteria group bacterium]
MTPLLKFKKKKSKPAKKAEAKAPAASSKASVAEIINDTIEDVLEKMGFSAEVVVETQPGEADSLTCRIEMEDAPLLIGKHGANLMELQYLIRLMTGHRFKQENIEDMPRFVIDINDYRAERWQEIRDMAKEAAELCTTTEDEVELPPLDAYERRIVHVVLGDNSYVETESEGTGPDRRVIVKPAKK